MSRADLELDRQLCFALYAASRAVTQAYGPLLADLDLTYPQYVVMLVLWEQADDGLTVGAIGRRLRLDMGTLSPLLKRLEAAGRIERVRDAKDERRVLVRLTGEGRAMRSRAESIPRRLVQRTGMPPSQVVALRSSLVSLLQHLDVVGRDADGA